jgi:beta-N-acetylhexosaminidase
MRQASSWVRARLAEMSIEQKIAQMLIPNFRPQSNPDDMAAVLVPGLDPGGVFFFGGTSDEFRRAAEWLQDRCVLPALVCSDLESGAGRMISDCVTFPDLMALAAAGSLELARAMGKATALEAREQGVHWTFGPVSDLNANPYNPIVNTRSLGDDPAKVSAFARELVASMQEHGLAACAKHFPGDGWDDRDQHLCTTINPLSLDKWDAQSGKVFADLVRAGVKSVMVGHIALPSVDPGNPNDPFGPPPATFSRKIVTALLRERLGFEGVVVTDALEMGGLVTRTHSRAELIVACVNAGCDALLFSETRHDFESLRTAVIDGIVPEERIDEAVSRILALKEGLGLTSHDAARPGRLLGAAVRAGFGASADAVARGAATLVADRLLSAARRLSPPGRVLVIHLRSNAQYNVDGFDALLAEAGFEVERRTEADFDRDWAHLDYSSYAAILFLWTMGPTWGTSDIRPGGSFMRIPWFVRQAQPACPMLHLNFGNPYLAHELPWADYVLNAYSPDIHSQRAVLDVILGKEEARGVSPVEIGRPGRLLSLIARGLTSKQ